MTLGLALAFPPAAAPSRADGAAASAQTVPSADLARSMGTRHGFAALDAKKPP